MDTHTLTLASQQKQHKGKLLKRADEDLKILNSGPLGPKRLLLNRILDLQEKIPGLTDEDAQKMAFAQIILTVGQEN
ncbi:MAG: hypothetical protein M0Q44_22415 [Methylobacter sp.]|nr:hypothetical protein [Methylobacter sp.]